jgi:hypothetical protein
LQDVVSGYLESQVPTTFLLIKRETPRFTTRRWHKVDVAVTYSICFIWTATTCGGFPDPTQSDSQGWNLLRYLKFNTANMSKIKGRPSLMWRPYISGYRTGSWVKFKNYLVQEFQIGGFTESRHHIESLLFGLFRDGDFIYVGNTDKSLPKGKQAEDLRSELANLLRNSSPFKNKPDVTGRVHWVEPKLARRVRFLERTEDSHVRHVVLLS